MWWWYDWFIRKDFKRLPRAKCVLVSDTLLRFRKLYFRSDLIVILPGGIGTLAEFASSVEEYRASLGNKKIILVNYDNFYDNLLDWLSSGQRKGFVEKDLKNCYSVVNTLDEFEKELNKFMEKSDRLWKWKI